jgi:hypothetical protein
MDLSESKRPIRVAVVDDHELFASSLDLFLECTTGVEFVGYASDGPSGIDLAVGREADVVLIDVGLPAMDGFEGPHARPVPSCDGPARGLVAPRPLRGLAVAFRRGSP